MASGLAHYTVTQVSFLSDALKIDLLGTILELEKKSVLELAGELQALRDVFAYNAFVRKKYFVFITKLPEKTLTKDRGASFPSILDILFTSLTFTSLGFTHIRPASRIFRRSKDSR